VDENHENPTAGHVPRSEREITDGRSRTINGISKRPIMQNSREEGEPDLFLFLFFKQDATFTGDKDNFIHILYVHKNRQPQVSIDLATLRSRIRCVTATQTSCEGESDHSVDDCRRCKKSFSDPA